MKRLNYLDYIKTPNDWKLKALDIPNQSQSKGHRPSAILIALAVVISLSGVGVFAVESDAIDILKRKLLDDTYTPYSYSGNYNDTLDSSALNEYIQTDVILNNLKISYEDMDFNVTGYINDRYTNYVTMDIILPKDENFVITNNTTINLDESKVINKDDNNESLGFSIDSITSRDNIISVVLETQSNDICTPLNDLYIYISDFGHYDDNYNFITDFEFNISFDISMEIYDTTITVDNINKSITLKDGTSTILESIEYSPFRIDFNFSSDSVDYYRQENLLFQQFTMYYIYNDGRKILINRDGMVYQSLANDINHSYTYKIFIDYAHLNLDLIDFTNIVAIELNGEVVPIK